MTWHPEGRLVRKWKSCCRELWRFSMRWWNFLLTLYIWKECSADKEFKIKPWSITSHGILKRIGGGEGYGVIRWKSKLLYLSVLFESIWPLLLELLRGHIFSLLLIVITLSHLIELHYNHRLPKIWRISCFSIFSYLSSQIYYYFIFYLYFILFSLQVRDFNTFKTAA